MNFSGIPQRTELGQFLRFTLRYIPKNAVVPILQGKLRGYKWTVGSFNHGCWLGSYEYEKRPVASGTDEHRQFFQEDVEAVYFDDGRELREKLVYWLHPTQDEARKKIAAAARPLFGRGLFIYPMRKFIEHFGLPVLAGG